MAKVDKIENPDSVVEKKVEKKVSKDLKKVRIQKKKKLRKIF